jgi:HEAT repeat protein
MSGPADFRARNSYFVVCAGTIVCLFCVSTEAGQFAADVQNLSSRNPTTRMAAYSRLLNSSGTAIDDIIAGADAAKDSGTKIQCLQLIRTIRSPKAQTEVLKLAQSDPDWQVRDRGVYTAGIYKNEATRAALAHIAQTDAVMNVRVAALSRYARIPGTDTKPTLVKFFSDPKIMIRLTAALELALQGDMRGYALAKKALKSDSPFIRESAIYVIARAGSPKDLPALEALANDPRQHPMVRFSAQNAISSIRLAGIPAQDQLTVLAGDMSNPSSIKRSWAAKSLAMQGDAGIKILTAIAKDPGNIGYREAISALYMAADQ